MAKVLVFALALATFACSNKPNPRHNDSPDPDVEVPITAKELPNVIGNYKGSFGRLVLHQDQSYSASFTQEIGFRTGPGSSPTRDYYANCTVTEFGTFELFQRNGFKHIRFKTTSADVVSAGHSNRGSKEFDPNEICSLYAKARLAKPLSQQYDTPAVGAIVLKSWPDIDSGTYKGENSYFLQLIDRPYTMGMLFSVENKSIDLTHFIGRFLQAAVISDSRLWQGKWAAEDFIYDSTSNKLTFLSNSCAIAVDFTPVITAIDGELSISAADAVYLREIDTEASRQFIETRTSGIPMCQAERDAFAENKLKPQAIALKFTSWMSIEFKYDFIRVEKEIPEPLRSEGTLTVLN